LRHAKESGKGGRSYIWHDIHTHGRGFFNGQGGGANYGPRKRKKGKKSFRGGSRKILMPTPLGRVSRFMVELKVFIIHTWLGSNYVFIRCYCSGRSRSMYNVHKNFTK